MVGPKSLGLWQGYDLAKCKGAFHTLLAMDDALGSVEISRGDEKLQRLHDGWAPLSRGFLEDQTWVDKLSTCGGIGLPPKKGKNKSIGNGFIFSLKINPSERIYFGIQKVKLIFHRWISKKSPTSTKPTYDKSARKKTPKKKPYRSIVSTGMTTTDARIHFEGMFLYLKVCSNFAYELP